MVFILPCSALRSTSPCLPARPPQEHLERGKMEPLAHDMACHPSVWQPSLSHRPHSEQWLGEQVCLGVRLGKEGREFVKRGCEQGQRGSFEPFLPDARPALPDPSYMALGGWARDAAVSGNLDKKQQGSAVHQGADELQLAQAVCLSLVRPAGSETTKAQAEAIVHCPSHRSSAMLQQMSSQTGTATSTSRRLMATSITLSTKVVIANASIWSDFLALGGPYRQDNRTNPDQGCADSDWCANAQPRPLCCRVVHKKECIARCWANVVSAFVPHKVPPAPVYIYGGSGKSAACTMQIDECCKGQ
eukprot:scaffold189285_cov20-Tisochrysis_lutea.AAC.1